VHEVPYSLSLAGSDEVVHAANQISVLAQGTVDDVAAAL
jgi:hypothetical protein